MHFPLGKKASPQLQENINSQLWDLGCPGTRPLFESHFHKAFNIKKRFLHEITRYLLKKEKLCKT